MVTYTLDYPDTQDNGITHFPPVKTDDGKHKMLSNVGSVLKKLVKRKRYPGMKKTVDMTKEQYQLLFNDKTATKFVPRKGQRLYKGDRQSCYKLDEQQFKSVFGILSEDISSNEERTCITSLAYRW
ncbi:ProA [Acrasis kona]|uniref:ProA n=1 Tax=Acrasis kona TaxID=1008807 RepID=A0AAW2ZQZ9_9EUKA